MGLKNSVEMRPKSFAIILITYDYTIDIPTMGSHMCFVFT